MRAHAIVRQNDARLWLEDKDEDYTDENLRAALLLQLMVWIPEEYMHLPLLR